MKVKKLIAAVMAFSIVCVALPTSGISAFDRSIIASAAEDDSDAPKSGKCGENVTWTLDDKGTLTISGTGEMDDWTFNNAPWSYCSSDIVNVVINDGITSIGNMAFYYCESLTSVTIPDSIVIIGVGAFGSCISLTSITLPECVESISDMAFSYCSGLTSIIVPNSVLNIGEQAFYRCEGLDSITISNSVTSIGNNAFGYCKSLTSLTLPNSVINIGDYAFSWCDNLTSIIIPESVKNIGAFAFSTCCSLASITIENPDCEISDNEFTIFNDYDDETSELYFNGTIYGYEGSTAQAYAEKYGRKFEVIGEVSEVMYGDVDGDAKVAASDAAMTLMEYANLASGEGTFTEAQFASCDVNEDGKIAADDAANILAYYTYLSGDGTEKDMKKWFSSLE